MIRSLSAVLLLVLLLSVPTPGIATAQEAAAQPAEEALPPELLSARKIFVLNTVMDFSLASAFTSEIVDWERFEIVFSEDDADLCFSLSAQADYQKQEIPSGQADDDGIGRRTVGTMRTLDNLYLKIFVPGGEDLWKDEVAVGEDAEAARDLVRRLRARIEKEEAGEKAR